MHASQKTHGLLNGVCSPLLLELRGNEPGVQGFGGSQGILGLESQIITGLNFKEAVTFPAKKKKVMLSASTFITSLATRLGLKGSYGPPVWDIFPEVKNVISYEASPFPMPALVRDKHAIIFYFGSLAGQPAPAPGNHDHIC